MAGEEAEASPFEEVSSTSANHSSASTTWDDTITVPTGTSRLILDILGITSLSAQASSDVLDPGGAADALTKIVDSDDVSGGGTVEDTLWQLAEADIDASGSATLRATISVSDTGFRRILILRGASSTIESAVEDYGDNAGSRTTTLTRSSGSFPTGSRVYVFVHSSPAHGGTSGFSGTATLVENVTIDNNLWIWGEATLGAPSASVTVTYDPDYGVSEWIQGIFVVEPA